MGSLHAHLAALEPWTGAKVTVSSYKMDPSFPLSPTYLDGAKVTASLIGMSSGTEFLFPWLGFRVLVSVT